MRQWMYISIPGILLGALLFAASLSPSLVPRPPTVQGLVSGVALAAGYAIGALLRWLWGYLELPELRGRNARIVTSAAATVCAVIALTFLWRASTWQNAIRALMDLEPVDGTRPFVVALIAVLVFGALLAAGKVFRMTIALLARWLERYVPRRVSRVCGLLAAAFLFWSLIDGVLFHAALRSADASYSQVDALMDDDVSIPADPLKPGGPGSLLAWKDLGRAGRRFVASGPSAKELSEFLGTSAPEPIRVYVGLNCAATIEARARLALEELVRVGGFERSVLIVVTPTGTGWIDPKALDTVEYLHRGDIASVAVQYSYLPSPLSLIAEPHYGVETAVALFREIYGHWRQLPADRRPRLYLHGLSLGALNSTLSFDILDVLSQPFQGALWSGPPFRSGLWRTLTARRNPDSPAWLPRVGDGSIVRFTNQENHLAAPTPWGVTRIIFLQYASDPITFFEPAALYREPAWMAEPRGPDVSPQLRWYPIVTMLQLAADMVAGDVAPEGYGHDYAPEDYIDAWLALTDPPSWSGEEIERLKAHYARVRRH